MHPTLSHRRGQRQSRLNLRALARDPRTGGGILDRWLRAAIRRHRRRQTIAALEALDDWTMKDIGIYRGDIHRLVAGFSDIELGMRAPAPHRRVRDTDAGGQFRPA